MADHPLADGLRLVEANQRISVGNQLDAEEQSTSTDFADMRMVAEGVKTARSVYNLSRKINVEMPICEEMYHILYQDLAPEVALHRLMTRELKYELDED